ncbi:hypothetical protein [Pseudomonas rhodesiae]|uniref:Uncharacterized protein n=1 Tax=Pseudomonas rhodesiae TaxID=76760 RepID=A0AAE8KZH8_9PSED|nr:hypothetical protein [Pseudomonas rhodesiae]TWR55403.1 hypothetical protein FIV35_11575 [Pseudomonas rhodesiae]SDV06622.1 hypothetical protein SAMN04490209_2601 [Pseudomonas rhodesiae]
MDDFPSLALSGADPHDGIAMSVTVGPSSATPLEPQTHPSGDAALIARLISLLSGTTDAALPAATTPVPIPELSLLGQWCAAFSKAVNSKDFIAWAATEGMVLSTLRVHDSNLHVTAHGVPKVFTLAGTSKWWTLAKPIIFISQLLDPLALGMPYIGTKSSDGITTLTLNLVLAFHGYPMPTNRLAALAIIEELRALQAFPAFDDNGRSKSIIHAELTQQRLDFQRLATALEQCDGTPSELSHTRVDLTSHSTLAKSVKEAALLLYLILDEHHLVDAQAHYDFARQLICVTERDTAQEQRTLLPSPTPHWERLVLLGAQLGVCIYPDHSVDLTDALTAYGFEPVQGPAHIGALIQRLRQWPTPAQPVVLKAVRTAATLRRFRHYVGMLNDRHRLRTVLAQVLDSGQLQGPDGLDRVISGDPDALRATVKSAYRHLRLVTDDPAFLALRTRLRIDPASHVLLSESGNIEARDLDGVWKSLNDAVAEHDHLMERVSQLRPLAARTGGQLRTNDTVSLQQALRLYGFRVPQSLADARRVLQRLEVSLPQRSSQGSYWRALKPRDARPSAWTLSPQEREQLVALSLDFMQGQPGTLFEYLSQPLLTGKTVADVRAEADYLIPCLLASPLAQQLGEVLSNTLHWHGSHASERGESGSRNALILAALILSLDPRFEAHPTGIQVLDWHGDFYWGESIPFVRRDIETAMGVLDRPTAALAAHLILSEKGPQLLVRDIPEDEPYLGSHTWTLFCQYVMYLEKSLPGSSRQLTHAQIMALAYLPPEDRWQTFLDSPQATTAVLEWAVVNGVLAPQRRYGTQSVKNAVDAINAQRTRLRSTLEAFAEPVVWLRQTALNDLRRVYPDNGWLEARILMWLPLDSPFSEDKRFEGIHTGPKYSFTDLHMAGDLDATSQHWHSSQPAVKYRQMAKRFHLLGSVSQVFFQAFDHKLQQLKAAYRESICFGLSQLTLPRREALEYGQVRFFQLSRPSASSRAAAQVGRFGVLMAVTYVSTTYVYECFPRQLLIRPRLDLDARQLPHGVDTASHFDWTAYAQGAWPQDPGSSTATTDMILTPLGNDLPQAPEVPPLDSLGRRVPRTLDSPRSHAVADIILEHPLHDGLALREKAKRPLTLLEAASGTDPWADFLLEMALKAD